MNSVSHIAPPASHAAPTLFAKRRAAIDLIATTRAKAIQIELFANYILHQHPDRPEDDARRQSWRAALQDQLKEMEHALQLIGGHDPSGIVDADIAEWMAQTAKKDPAYRQAYDKIVALARSVVSAAQDTEPSDLQKAIEAHAAFGRSEFFRTVTAFLDVLWSELDDSRDKEVARARGTAAAIGKTLQRLEHIGKHVRLVSLNASVEAARVGEEGRGLGVIAVEFKTLAEEIQHLATTARADVSDMERHADDGAAT